jgi:hypothetical protein
MLELCYPLAFVLSVTFGFIQGKYLPDYHGSE